jgi:hypothetical protein
LTQADPREIGGCQIVARLGSGMTGQVYLATGSRGERPDGWTAVKVFDEDLVADSETRRRLVTGALAASVLSGDHLASVTNSDTRARQPWVASTLVCGPSLAATVTETGPLPASAVGWMMLGLASDRAIAVARVPGRPHPAGGRSGGRARPGRLPARSRAGAQGLS